MKKFLFVLAFLFSVVCYSAPPPEKSTSFIAADVGVIRSQDFIVVQAFEVQEVTFAYIGNVNSNTGTINKVMIENTALLLDQYANRLIDKQHSNYGYPFAANYFFFMILV